MSVVSEFGRVRKITCEEFERMIELNVFREDERIELLDGLLTEMSPQSVAHSFTVTSLTRYLSRRATNEELVLVQQPVFANGVSLPEPDLAIVPPSAYWCGRPRASESLLLVEVSLSSLAVDRRKSKLYAQAGAPEFWLVNVAARQTEIHTEPGADGYKLIRILSADDEISPGFNPSAKIPLRELLPGPELDDDEQLPAPTNSPLMLPGT